MTTLLKIIKYQLHDLLRGKWFIIYTAVFFLLTDGLFRFGGDSGQVALSLMNVVLFIIPLVSIVFGTMFFYNSREFMELLLSQPISRVALFLGLYLGLTLPLSAVYLIGVGIPFMYHAGIMTGGYWILLLVGVSLTWVFTALAFLIAVLSEQRVKGVGMTIVLWLFFAILYDGIILFILFALEEYPLEKLTLILSLFNPIDLGRILMLLQFDIAALMGYTGALFSKFYGNMFGSAVAVFALWTWCAIPAWLGYRAFSKKDF
ncbi:MAG: ABC transporter permease subunit [FCB group bacterium]|nr:ABC transporter permease subunit [FCB group bacterium]MBL7029333.1 ABC transporter permease subunit [Candidatus Neomarinimicrobiota bacterium]MBL7120732.1 ABC transporter permease subunit [Candidatus Neomarinimicrobiota bacterium]